MNVMKTFLETYQIKEKRKLKEAFIEKFDDYIKEVCSKKRGDKFANIKLDSVGEIAKFSATSPTG